MLLKVLVTTLTNTDNKLPAKVLAERLNGIILTLVSEDQVGYIRGRNVPIVIRTIDDVIDYLYKTKEQLGYSLAVDFRAYGIPYQKFLCCMFSKHLNLVQTFKKCVSLNQRHGLLHGPWWMGFGTFEVLCGTRQGCPIFTSGFCFDSDITGYQLYRPDLHGDR